MEAKKGLLPIPFPKKNDEKFVVSINGNVVSGNASKDVFLNTIVSCGLKRVYDLHLKYNPKTTAKEHFDVLDVNPHPIKHYADMQKTLSEDGQTYYLIDGMRNDRKKEILQELSKEFPDLNMTVE